jgi:hypothetical protein
MVCLPIALNSLLRFFSFAMTFLQRESCHAQSVLHVSVEYIGYEQTSFNALIVGVACERAIRFGTKIRLIKAGHASPSLGRLPRLTRCRFDIRLAETIGLFPKRFQSSSHEFHLNS